MIQIWIDLLRWFSDLRIFEQASVQITIKTFAVIFNHQLTPDMSTIRILPFDFHVRIMHC